MKKSIAKSVRLSPQVNDYICNFEGNGFNEKFENIILFCMQHEPEIRKRAENYEELVKERRYQLDEINRELSKARVEAVRFRELLREMDFIKKVF